MLGSWFVNKSTDEGHSEGTTPRPSLSSPNDNQDNQRTSSEKPPRRAFSTAYTTPHDAIIADLQNSATRSTSGDAHTAPYNRDEQDISPEPESTAVREPSRTDPSFLSPMLGQQYPGVQQQSSRSQLLLDPFDGNVLGVLVPYQEPGSTNEDMSSSQVNISSNPDANVSTGNIDTRSEAIWSQLSRILELQGQLSKMHLEMENIGTGKAADPRRKKHKQRDGSAPERPNPGLDEEDPPVPPGIHRPRKRTMSNGSRGSLSGEADGDEEGVNMPSEEAEKDRRRGEEFAKLATQFEGRKEAINDIMGKLDDLSKLLFEFHDLKSPNIEFPASRNNSIATTARPASTSPPRSSTVESRGYTIPLSLPRSTTTTSNRTHDWAQQNIASSSKVSVPLRQARDETSAPPRGATTQKKLPPALLINSIDPQMQSSVMDSPASTIGSMKLPREE